MYRWQYRVARECRLLPTTGRSRSDLLIRPGPRDDPLHRSGFSVHERSYAAPSGGRSGSHQFITGNTRELPSPHARAIQAMEIIMPDSACKIIAVTGASQSSREGAARRAIAVAGESPHKLRVAGVTTLDMKPGKR